MKTAIKILKFVFLSTVIMGIGIVWLFGHSDIPLDELKQKYAGPASSFVSVNGLNVHYRDEGDLTDTMPIVLIHGTGSSLHTFDGWTDELEKNHRVVRMDLPAYGLTGPFPDRDYSMESYVAFVKHFLDAVGIDQCILGGNSLGGGIAWSFTGAHPEMVDRLILIDASGYPTEAKSTPLAFSLARVPVINGLFTHITPRFVAKESVENVYADKSKVTEGLVDRYFELTLRAGNRQAFVDRLMLDGEADAYREIRSIEQKTLILWGDQDQLIPLENAYRFQKDLVNDTLVVMNDVGHVPMEESPKESVEHVLNFLK